MKTSRMKLGIAGEELACNYLIDKEHIILERNWRWSHLEVDIISLHKGEIHFVEVKTRVGPLAAEPEECVNLQKQKRLVRAAEAYLHSPKKNTKGTDFDIVFDVFSVIFEGDNVELRYFPRAFIPMIY